MKLVNENISFDRGKGPREALGIGIFSKRDFSSREDMYKFLARNIDTILGRAIPDNFIAVTPEYTAGIIKIVNAEEIREYMRKYITINGVVEGFHSLELAKALDRGVIFVPFKDLDMGKDLVSESLGFERGKSAKKSLGIGPFTKKDFETKEEAAEYIFNIIPLILDTKGIPGDFLVKFSREVAGSSLVFIRKRYLDKIWNYIDLYLDERDLVSKTGRSWNDLISTMAIGLGCRVRDLEKYSKE